MFLEPALGLLIDCSIGALNVSHWAAVISEAAWQRRVYAVADLAQKNPDEATAKLAVLARGPVRSPAAARDELRILSAASLGGIEVPTHAWVVPGFVPSRKSTLFYGPPGGGKTTLLQQAATAVAISGTAWLRREVAHGPALCLFAEDELVDVHIRQAAINADLGVSMTDLGNLYFAPLLGEDVTVARQTGHHQVEFDDTVAQRIRRVVMELKPRFLVIDTLFDFYAGSEVDRSSARAVTRWFNRLALEADCAVVLTAHPSLRGVGDGSGGSGTTGWEGGVRSRLYLHRPDGGDEPGHKEADDGARVLEVMKSNLGRTGERIELFYDRNAHVFKARSAVGCGVTGAIERSQAERVFLRLLSRLWELGHEPAVSKQSPDFAPKLMLATFNPMDRERLKLEALIQALNKLLVDGAIRIEDFKTAGRKHKRVFRVVEENTHE